MDISRGTACESHSWQQRNSIVYNMVCTDTGAQNMNIEQQQKQLLITALILGVWHSPRLRLHYTHSFWVGRVRCGFFHLFFPVSGVWDADWQYAKEGTTMPNKEKDNEFIEWRTQSHFYTESLQRFHAYIFASPFEHTFEHVCECPHFTDSHRTQRISRKTYFPFKMLRRRWDGGVRCCCGSFVRWREFWDF